MDHTDFLHLVRLSEQASASDGAGYRRKVALFAGLGYAWVIGCLLIAAALLWWSADHLIHHRFKFGILWLLIAAVGLLWSSLRALWIRFDIPTGIEVTAADAPELFDLLERIRKRVQGPRIDRVILDGEFNASIHQLPRWGVLGHNINVLTIGLPFVMALDRQRLAAVLAHEYGHLRGDHGRFGAWIYRSRLSWSRLYDEVREDESVVTWATRKFLGWYMPRFTAKTFALAREDEYEADRVSARIVGPDVAGAALKEIAIKGRWLQQKFWRGHWLAAASQSTPVGPFRMMRRMLALPIEMEFARETLRDEMNASSDAQDTHPALRDRLDSLNQDGSVPTWSAKSSLQLLGSRLKEWSEQLDREWCADHARGWALRHSYLGRVQARIAQLTASAGANRAEDMVELGSLRRRLDPNANASADFEGALSLSPQHALALRGLIDCLPPSAAPRRMTLLQMLHDAHAAHRWWACTQAIAQLERQSGKGGVDLVATDRDLQIWRSRLAPAEHAERRAFEELALAPPFQSISRHDLNEFELGELRSDLSLYAPVESAWVLKRNLKEFPSRRCYLLFVATPGHSDAAAAALCEYLRANIDLPGPVIVHPASGDTIEQDLRRHAGEPVYRNGAEG